jgi:hypothetical protein
MSKPTTLQKLLDCFHSNEDFFMFLNDWIEVTKQSENIEKLLTKFEGNQESQTVIMAHLLLEIGIFCRNNFDTLKDIVNTSEWEYVDQEKLDELLKGDKTITLPDILKKFQNE